MAIERMTKVVERVERDYCWDRATYWHADGMGIHVSGADEGRVMRDRKGPVLMVGGTATYELVDGRWTLARFEPKG